MKKALLFLFIVLLFLQFANADSPIKKVYVTNNVNPHTPVIDGKLDDPVWDKVSWAGDFIQRSPDEGKEPSQATAFKILYKAILLLQESLAIFMADLTERLDSPVT